MLWASFAPLSFRRPTGTKLIAAAGQSLPADIPAALEYAPAGIRGWVSLRVMDDNPSESGALLDAAVAQYDLDVAEIDEVRVINNAVFRLRTPSRDYALRIHRPGHRLPTQIRSELVYLASLAEGSEVVVPFPIATRSGEFVALVDAADGVRHASLVTWLGGEVRRPGRGAGAATLFRIGKALGRTHQFSESFDPPDGFDLPIWDVAAMFDSERLRLVESVSHRRLIEQVAQWVEEHFDELTPTPETHGVLHHDFILLNCLHSGRQTAVIDFDDSGWGFYLQDLGGMLGNLKDHSSYRSLRRSFVAGYESIRPFPSADERDLELMVALRHCTNALWLHELRAAGAMTEDLFQRNLTYRIAEIRSSVTALAR